MSEEAREEAAEYWGLEDPPVERFIKWADNTLHGDLGDSITYGIPVSQVIAGRFWYSLALILTAWVLSGIIGFGAGILAALYRGSLVDRCIRTFCLVLQSAPVFWFGLLMLTVFSVALGWFPTGQAAPAWKLAEDVTLWDRIYHMILPAVTLSILGISKITLYTRQKNDRDHAQRLYTVCQSQRRVCKADGAASLHQEHIDPCRDCSVRFIQRAFRRHCSG